MKTLKKGKDNFFMVGEIAADSDWQGRYLGNQYTNPANPLQHGEGKTAIPETLTTRIQSLKPIYSIHPSQKFPGVTSIYDFSHGGTTREVFRNTKSPMEL
eukprot:Pgem_evm1s15027